MKGKMLAQDPQGQALRTKGRTQGRDKGQRPETEARGGRKGREQGKGGRDICLGE